MHTRFSLALGAVLTLLTVPLFCRNHLDEKTESGPPQKVSAQSDNAQNGNNIFVKVGCYACHGREAQGEGAYGPRLAPNPMPYPAFVTYVRAPAGEMPKYAEKVLSDAQLIDIYAFLKSQPHPPSADKIPILK
ncbi:MAG TPA: cytochrome c [Terriglobales bacterium]|jgi:mono/diheme cytochrome c family protein